jgi:hypothetical protein
MSMNLKLSDEKHSRAHVVFQNCFTSVCCTARSGWLRNSISSTLAPYCRAGSHG